MSEWLFWKWWFYVFFNIVGEKRMGVHATFQPNPVTGDDPLDFATASAQVGIYGSGNDTPVLLVESDGSVYELTAVSDGFECELADPSNHDGRMFRRLHGEVSVVDTFVS